MRMSHRHRQALHLYGTCCRRFTLLTRAIAENEVVALRPKRSCDKSSLRLAVPLVPGGRIQSHRGIINHEDIIGKLPRESVSTNKGHEYTIHRPTLAEYIELTPRRVTPASAFLIYPADANLIVSLLDIHVTPPGLSEGDTRLEILEGGTGHGALTLYLARAVHAANTARPPLPPVQNKPPDPERQISPTVGETSEGAAGPHKESEAEGSTLEREGEQRRAFEEWKLTRGAIVHTLDVDPHNSRHAERIVRGFQRGMYVGNVEFYTGDVSEWVTSQLQQRRGTGPTAGYAFLSHIFLDIPGVHNHLHRMQDALHVDGLLVVFTPSITQIATCVQIIKEKKLSFAMDQVVELGLATTGLGSGRQWDVRVAKTSAGTRKLAETKLRSTGGQIGSIQSGPEGREAPLDQDSAQGGDIAQGEADLQSQVGKSAPRSTNGTLVGERDLFIEGAENQLKMICRPKVGERIARLAGGGFVAVWRRMRDMRPAEDGDVSRR